VKLIQELWESLAEALIGLGAVVRFLLRLWRLLRVRCCASI